MTDQVQIKSNLGDSTIEKVVYGKAFMKNVKSNTIFSRFYKTVIFETFIDREQVHQSLQKC